MSVALAAGLVVFAGCGGSPTAPDPGPPRVSIEGTWSGSITDRTSGTAQLSMTLSGLDTTGFGTFALAFPDPAANLTGILQGSTRDAPTIDLALFVRAGGRDCMGTGVSYTARLALVDNRMTGTYTPAVGCPLLAGGSMELTRR